MKQAFTVAIALFVIVAACKPKPDAAKLEAFSKNQLHAWNQKLTEVIVKDIFTPPVASRIYVYPNIAAYEALLPDYPAYQSLAGQLHGLQKLPAPPAGKEHYLPAASIIAFSTVAQKLVFAQPDIEAYEADYLKKIKETGIDNQVLENSIAYGRTLGNNLLSWIKKDGYKERTALPRYILMNEPGKWQPTAPGYMPAIEPHWNKIRPMLLDSCAQFKPAPPTTFDTARHSAFFKEALEVYQTVNNLDKDQREIASFWDCNPNISYTKGHVMLFHQKISPGGHWMSITATIARNKQLDLIQTSEAFTRVAIALFDGFISCWDEKYRSNLLRPETYIEKYIDPSWDPVLQTPPFPEYPSGHSVVSGAAATTLTHLFGENIAFTDSTEVPYGLPVRTFDSFYHASSEAAISRLYGGIHFRPAIENGSRQGRLIGQWVVHKLHTRKDALPPKEIAQTD